MDKEGIYKDIEKIYTNCKTSKYKYGSNMIYRYCSTSKYKVCIIDTIKDDVDIEDLMLSCDGMVEYSSGVVKFKIPGDINGRSVICINDFVYKVIYSLKSKLLSCGLWPDEVIVDLTQSDLSNIVDAKNIFYYLRGCRLLMPVGDRQLQPVGMRSAFSGSHIYNISDVIHHIDFSKTISLNSMFAASLVEHVDFKDTNLSQVKDVVDMFGLCSKLRYVEFDQGTFSNVDSTLNMFEQCSSLTEFDMGCFTGSTLKILDFMFSRCNSLQSVKTPKGWGDCITDLPLSISASYVFERCENLKDIDFTGFIRSFRFSCVHASVFYMCKSLSMSNRKITINSKLDIVRILFSTMSSAVDIRGTRIDSLRDDKCTVSSLEEYFIDRGHPSVLNGRILIIDSWQYNKYKDSICEYAVKYDSNLIECDSSMLEITLMKYNLFGRSSTKKGLEYILVDKEWKDDTERTF